jgi:flagellar hook assembly protein FlgD
VRTLVDGSQEGGYRRIEWDGKNERGKNVASGVHFYRIKAGNFSDSKKMVILK